MRHAGPLVDDRREVVEREVGTAGAQPPPSRRSPAATRRQNELLRPIVERAGFDYLGGLIATPRSLIHVFELVYDTKDRAQTDRAYAACRELVVAAARAGHGEYRAHLSA
jgi:hypothetical protein